MAFDGHSPIAYRGFKWQDLYAGNTGDSNRSVLPTSSNSSTGLANHIAVVTILQGHKSLAWQSYCGKVTVAQLVIAVDCRSSTFCNIKLSECLPILKIMLLRLASFGWCNSHEKCICPDAFSRCLLGQDFHGSQRLRKQYSRTCSSQRQALK